MAAAQGNMSGQMYLGNAYRFGIGVIQDYIQAHMWYNLAGAHNADPRVIKLLAEFREELEKNDP